MSQRMLNSVYQNVGQSENEGGRSRSHTTPITCIVCDEVFYDNVSLVLHFLECHRRCENSTPGQNGGDLASLRGRSPLSLSRSPFPSVKRTYAAHHTASASPIVNNCLRPSPWPVSSETVVLAPTGASPFVVHVLNSMPPMISSVGAQFSVPQNAVQARVPNPRIPHHNQREEPMLIVLTDSEEKEEEEEGDNSAEEIDLTLRL